MKKIISALIVVTFIAGIGLSVANFIAKDLNAFVNYGTYQEVWISGVYHGWICSGPRVDCAVGGPD